MGVEELLNLARSDVPLAADDDALTVRRHCRRCPRRRSPADTSVCRSTCRASIVRRGLVFTVARTQVSPSTPRGELARVDRAGLVSSVPRVDDSDLHTRMRPTDGTRRRRSKVIVDQCLVAPPAMSRSSGSDSTMDSRRHQKVVPVSASSPRLCMKVFGHDAGGQRAQELLRRSWGCPSNVFIIVVPADPVDSAALNISMAANVGGWVDKSRAPESPWWPAGPCNRGSPSSWSEAVGAIGTGMYLWSLGPTVDPGVGDEGAVVEDVAMLKKRRALWVLVRARGAFDV